MPQMAPLSWVTLMIYFTIIFLMINPLNYFLFIKTSSYYSTKLQHTPLNWKW
uniref:ATP synthase complex subunit 8 n=1 Tax=Apatides fortis TaxID=590156 RepID=D1G5N8_APAFO|nr:ATP synthase F0 subunit 8 [Apatides fortis]ACM45053.1 ATP synthase F0 subunit 8 [Apatides fortis]